MTAPPPLLEVCDLTVSFGHGKASKKAIDRLSFSLAHGERIAVVGESGSGKTMLGRAILRLLPEGARVSAAALSLEGQDILSAPEERFRDRRGRDIGMVFQEPMVSLNPSMKIGQQIIEAVLRHTTLNRAQAVKQAVASLARIRIREPERCLGQYPHEFSGGMRQRIMLAAVMALKPKLLIADEPTTALDCIVQKEVLDLMVELTEQNRTALIFISHNLSLVTAYTDRVLVMCKGELIEQGEVGRVIATPQHPYTRELLDALPKRRGHTSDQGATVLSVQGAVVDYPLRSGLKFWRKDVFRALHPLSFDLHRGETLGVVGESGSGKTTLSRAILGLTPLSAGSVHFGGRAIDFRDPLQLQAMRREVQIVFQDPYSSLDPRMKVGDIIGEGLRHETSITPTERAARAKALLAEVGLDPEHIARYVHEFSGGQRQRIAIARALISNPSVLIADEAVSSLDVTVQRQILSLIKTLQQARGFGCIFISHDLGVIDEVSDRVLVMYRGFVVEDGRRDLVLDTPAHPYTRRLLEAIPLLVQTSPGRFEALPKVRAARQFDFGLFDPDASDARPMPMPMPMPMPVLRAIGHEHATVPGAPPPHRVAAVA